MPTSPRGAAPTGTVLAERVWKKFRADEVDPSFLGQMSHLGKRLRGHRREFRWVLKDINLEIEPGATVALTGINGSGKSTLLRVISQVTYQSTGRIQVEGRIGALLELRSGIHPELTGRENVYLFGTILGLTRRVVAAKFDEIVEFAGLAEAIDRQVKYYSSGMTVRLGFSIAAFLDPDVLLVDEVLAVGDASFQQKCLRRISEVVATGATLIFVSHDLAAVEAMCDRTIWLADAIVRADGPSREVLALYRKSVEMEAEQAIAVEKDPMQIVKVDIAAPDKGLIMTGGELEARVVLNSPEFGDAAFIFGVTEGPAMPIFVVRHRLSFPAGQFEVRCLLSSLPLPMGNYYLWFAAQPRRMEKGAARHLVWRSIGSFEVFGPSPNKAPKGVMVLSPVHVDASWEIA